MGTDKGLILVWQLQTGEVLHRLGGSHAASASAKQHLSQKGAAQSSSAGHVVRVNALCFSADGSSLFSVGEDRMVMQWNMSSGQVIQCVLLPSLFPPHVPLRLNPLARITHV